MARSVHSKLNSIKGKNFESFSILFSDLPSVGKFLLSICFAVVARFSVGGNARFAIESVKCDFMVECTHSWSLSKRANTHSQKSSKRLKSFDVQTRNWNRLRPFVHIVCVMRATITTIVSNILWAVGCVRLRLSVCRVSLSVLLVAPWTHTRCNKPTINRNHYPRTMSPMASTSHSFQQRTHFLRAMKSQCVCNGACVRVDFITFCRANVFLSLFCIDFTFSAIDRDSAGQSIFHDAFD